VFLPLVFLPFGNLHGLQNNLPKRTNKGTTPSAEMTA
jgi:hypothetical protein